MVKSEKSAPTLQQQLKAFEAVGLTLNSGVTIDDLEYSLPAEEYEAKPYWTLFFVLGVEVGRRPWGRRFSNQVWNFDFECVEGPGSYKRILENLCVLTNRQELVDEVIDPIEPEGRIQELSYRIDGTPRALAVRIDDDWADAEAIRAILSDIENTLNCGRRFWSADNGQAVVLTFLANAEAARINALADGLLRPGIGQPSR